MHLDLSAPTQQLLDMVNGFLNRLPYLVIAALVFWLFLFLAKMVRGLMAKLSQQRLQTHNLGLVLGRLAQGGIVFLGLLVALVIAIPSFKPAQLIQILGLSSVAIGFAFKDILQNYLAGILLLVNEPFRIGDQIVMGGYEGTVESIQTRATYIKTYDGRRVVIPNGDLYTHSVTVNTAFPSRRLQYDVGIGSNDDIRRAKTLLIEAAREAEGTLNDPAPEALVVGFGDNGVTLRLRWWIDPPRRADMVITTDRVLEKVHAKFAANGIDLPYPTQQILFHDQTEETDGDRRRQREGWPAGNGPVPRSRAAVQAEFRAPRPASETAEQREPANQ